MRHQIHSKTKSCSVLVLRGVYFHQLYKEIKTTSHQFQFLSETYFMRLISDERHLHDGAILNEKTINEVKITSIVTLVYAAQKKLVIETFFDCHRLLDTAELVNRFIDDFNNFIHRLMKASKKVFEILIDYAEKSGL